MNQTVETILKRRSVRDFLDKPISEEELQTIIKCGLFAPSAKNRQNWHFTVITNKDKIDEISKQAVDGMNKIGLDKEEGYHIFYHAPTVIVISSKIEGYSEINAGCVAENMALAAKSLGIGSCIVGQTRYLYHQAPKPDVNSLLKIPKNHEFDVSICFGYPTDDEIEAPERKENLVDYIR
ncbi:MAG: nitroreductase [Tenericutes bacterium]|nr:nitroreductase [Mycoplasmatota bacterium]